MPPFLDFSSALPWLGSGFVLGLIVSWLVRKISGVDARRIREIETLSATVDDARRAHEGLTAANGQLEAERSRLTAEINQLSPRAALAPQLERQAAELKHALANVQSTADAASNELSALRQSSAKELAALTQEAEVKGSTAKYYEEEYGRLHAAHQLLGKEWTSATDTVNKLQSDYAVASREASEATRLRSDIGALRAQIESLRADVDTHKHAAASRDNDVKRVTGELQQARAAYAKEFDRLKAQLDAAPKEDHSAEVARLNDETQRLNNETTRLNGEISQLRGSLQDAGNSERAAAMDLHSTRTDLAQVRTALEETTRLLAERHTEVEQLRSKLAAVPDVESYRRFKEALEAANRIASGMPEKG